ncbi:MAG: hypothetical protein HOP10_15175 [Chitinophagaceae bacterium]|nr:hypothetical protein [Chitinophagaceae bacterium]
MRYMKWTGPVAAVLLIISCFAPWAYISVIDFTATGLDAGKQFRSPGYFNFAFVFLFLVFTFIPRIWAKQWNLLVTAVNLGWAIRNFFKLSSCEGGECPVRKWGLYLMLIASVLMLVSALFPGIKLPGSKDNASGASK